LIKLKAIKILGNGNKIKEVAAQRSSGQMVTAIGGTSRMAREKDMGCMSKQNGADIAGNGRMMYKTATEFKHGQMEKHIMESGRMACSAEKDISGGLMAMNTAENMWMESNLEKESKKRKENYTKSHIRKTR
jgi:hypothetical protein